MGTIDLLGNPNKILGVTSHEGAGVPIISLLQHYILQGPVVQKLVNTNPGLKFNQGFIFSQLNRAFTASLSGCLKAT